MNRNNLFVLLIVLVGLSSIALSAPMFSHAEMMNKMIMASNSSNGSNPNTNTCTSNTSCAGKGDSCTGDLSRSMDCTNGSSCCAMGLYCINSTCATDNMGDPCKFPTDCYPPSSSGDVAVNCVGGYCVYAYGPGDTCTNTTDCMPGLSCNNSVCIGLAQGANCAVGDAICGYGLYCGVSNGTTVCLPMVGSGGKCGAFSPCAPNYMCYNGTCQQYYSQQSGAKCLSDHVCASGLACSLNGTCTAVTDDLVSCTDTANCTGNGGICICSFVTGNSYCLGGNYLYDPCSSEKATLATCLASSNCSSATDAPDSCCYNNCLSDYKKTFSCGCSLADSLYGDCFYNQYCGGFPVWAIIVIIVVAIVLVLGIVLLVFFMMRRRRQYDSI